MSNLRQAKSDFKKKCKERDDMVAHGYVDYAVRFYKVVLHLLKNGKPKDTFFYASSDYETIDGDKYNIGIQVEETAKTINALSDKIKVKDYEIILIEEA